MVIKLPKPPSVNHLYKITTRGGFVHQYIGAEGKQWFMDAGKILHDKLKLQKPIDYKVCLDIWLSTAKGQDVDNVGKATGDLLQKCLLCMKNKCPHHYRVLENDRLVYDLHIRKQDVPHLNEQGIYIEITPYQKGVFPTS